MSNFDVDTLDLDSLKGESERLDQTGAKPGFLNHFLKLPEGNCNFTIRLLPPRKGKKPYQATRLHKINGRFVHCRRELVNGKWVGECPICSYYTKLWKVIEKLEKEGKTSEAESLKDEARGLKPIERYYWNCIARKVLNEEGEVETNVGPKVYSCGKLIQKSILHFILGDPEANEAGLGDVMNIRTGRDFKIVKKIVGSGKEAYPRYEGSKFLDQSPLGEDAEVARWIEEMLDLSTLRILKSPEELEKQIAIHRGLIPDERDDSGFDIDALDRKYGNTPSAKAPVSIEDVVSPVADVANAESTPAPAPEVELSIDDEKFIAELQNIQNS